MPGSKVDVVRQEIDNIINTAISGDITETEIQKIKNRIETKNIYRRQLILAKADMLAHFKTFYGDAELINTNITHFLGVTKDDIITHSQKYLLPKNRVTLIYLPVRNKD